MTPAPVPVANDTVIIPSKSGSTLRALLIHGTQGAGAVLLLHGVGADRSSMLGRVKFLTALGFTVLAPDFQAHGESPGKHVTYGARESLDAESAVSYLREVAPGERVGVIGVSMGGAAALLGPGPVDANAFVLESVYPTIRDAVSDRLETWFYPFGAVGRSLAPAVINVIGPNVGVTEAELQPIDRVGLVRAPIFFLAGDADSYTPLGEAESLYARATAPKSYWWVTGAGHEDLHAFATVEYERRVGAFLQQNLRISAASH